MKPFPIPIKLEREYTVGSRKVILKKLEDELATISEVGSDTLETIPLNRLLYPIMGFAPGSYIMMKCNSCDATQFLADKRAVQCESCAIESYYKQGTIWTYQGKEFTSEMVPENSIGFVYLMTVEDPETGKVFRYIGKKFFNSNVKTKLGKRSLPTDKRLKDYKIVTRPSYLKYFSSNDVLKEYHKAGVLIKREILQICDTKIQLSYSEVEHQMKRDVLRDPEYLNSNILGKFFKNRI